MTPVPPEGVPTSSLVSLSQMRDIIGDSHDLAHPGHNWRAIASISPTLSTIWSAASK
ncbi:MAG: hypothetical protein ACJAYX_004321 [Planctomycetota bacterium]|jgi:hypothetical protein